MESKKYLFEEDSIWHAFAVMALPAIASQLITLIYNLADTFTVIVSYIVYAMIRKKEGWPMAV